MSNHTAWTTYIPPDITIRVIPDLPNGAELSWSTSGDVTLKISPQGAFPGNIVYLLRWAADQLERHLTPDSSGYLRKRRLRPVPALIPAQQDGAQR